MDLHLPDITIQEKWTIPGQVKKIGEEYSEVAEAVALADPINAIREALDTAQTCCTLINMIIAEYDGRINFERLKREHIEKLRKKGYLCE